MYQCTNLSRCYINADGDICYKGNDYFKSDIRCYNGSSRYIDVPCGQCWRCRQNKAVEWANKIMMEVEYCRSIGQQCWFFTWTINDENISNNYMQFKKFEIMTDEITEKGFYREIRSYPADESLRKFPSKINGHNVIARTEIENSEYLSSKPSVKIDDVQAFLKRLRRHYEYHKGHKGIYRYYVSEYGTESFRPHYHGIIFNLPMDDLIEFKKEKGQVLYISPTIAKLWTQGFHTIGEANIASARYVAQYVLKKMSGNKSDYYYNQGLLEINQRDPKKTLGKRYVLEHQEDAEKYKAFILEDGKGRKIPLPKFYDKIVEDKMTEEEFKSYKLDKRERAQEKLEQRARTQNLNVQKYIENKAIVYEEKKKGQKARETK